MLAGSKADGKGKDDVGVARDSGAHAADPSKVLARSRTPVMEPEEPYELEGFFGNVIFTNGHLVDGDRIALYYGASDKVICRADLSVGEILENLRKDL